MTTAMPSADASPVAAAGARGAVSIFAGLLRAEWTKIRSVRSTVWTLLLFVVITVGLTALLTTLVVHSPNDPRAAERDARIVADPSALYSARASA